MHELHTPVGVKGVLVGRLDGVQVGPQVVALGGDKAQVAVDVHRRAVPDLVAGSAQDRVRHLALGHHLVGHRQRVGRRNVPLGVGRLHAGCFHHRAGAGNAGLHVVAGIVKHLLALHVAHRLAVDTHFQPVGLAQLPLDHQRQADQRACGQHISKDVPHQRQIPLGPPLEVAEFLGADLLPAFLRVLFRQLPDVPHAGIQPHKGLEQIFQKNDQPRRQRPENGKQQRPHMGQDGRRRAHRRAPGADRAVFQPEAEHIQHVADHAGMGHPLQQIAEPPAPGGLALAFVPPAHRPFDCALVPPLAEPAAGRFVLLF